LSATHTAGERLSPLPESTFESGAIIGFKRCQAGLEELAARHDDHVEPCRDLVASENLSYQPLSAISLNGAAKFFRGRNPQTTRVLTFGQDKHGAEAAMEPGTVLVHLLKLGPAANPLVPPKMCVCLLRSIHRVVPC
jgi:hypothetical protein